MDVQAIVSELLMVIAVLVLMVNVITEVVKKVFAFHSEQTINLFVTAISIIITVLSFLAFWELKHMTITWYLVVAFVIVGFMVAYSAMFGFDKLLKYFEDLRGK